MTKEMFENAVYEAYKLDWMLSHGLTMKDYLDALIEADMDAAVNGNYPEGDATSIYTSLAANVCERGFGSGLIWSCKSEFMETEFEDEYYMDHLLNTMPNSKDLRIFYTNNYKSLPDSNLLGEVGTKAGVLRAYRLTDPGAPGICVMLQPDAYEEEIDVCMAEVVENPDYGTSFSGNENDVTIRTWGDPSQEDYTNKEVIRRDEVIAALGTAAHA